MSDPIQVAIAKRFAELEREVERLREALQEIADWKPSSGIPYKSAVVGMQQVANRALVAQPQRSEPA